MSPRRQPRTGANRLDLLHLLELATRGTWGLPETRDLCRLQFWIFMSELYLMESGARAAELAQKALLEVREVDEGRRRNGA